MDLAHPPRLAGGDEYPGRKTGRGDIPHLLVYLEDIPSEVCLRPSPLTSSGKSGFADHVTEIVFVEPNCAGFTSASLPPADDPSPILRTSWPSPVIADPQAGG